MAGLNLTVVTLVGLGLPVLALHLVAVAFTRALRTYSRSRLEEVAARRGHPERADAIAHEDERTERSAEALVVVTGLALAALLGVAVHRLEAPRAVEAAIVLALGVWGVGHLAAGVVGRAYAEGVLEALWPVAGGLRGAMAPATAVARGLEALVYRGNRGAAPVPPRPASVEVELPSAFDADEDPEADLPDETRAMLENVLDLARRDVAEVMTPRSLLVALPATVPARAAAQVFVDSGRSRIPVFGENRDDIVGILYAKDLFAHLFEGGDPAAAVPRDLARPALFVPDSKNATELLAEFRTQRTQMAVVLDEFGGVTGVVTLEDLLEEVVGPIDDEHDPPTPADAVVPRGDARFEVEGTLALEDLNERLGLHLPTDADFMTVGGFAFHALGRLPEPGASFRHAGIELTVLEVGDHSIRRLLIDLQPAAAVGRP